MRDVIEVSKGVAIGTNYPPFFVAEIGQNHNGSVKLAKKLIDVALESGATAVKFTKRDLQSDMTGDISAMPYNNPHSFGSTYGEHREYLELTLQQHQELSNYSRERRIIYFSSVCDIPSVDVMREIDIPLYKVASRDLTNLPLIEYIAKQGKPMILSTGMATMEEIRLAVDVVRRYHDQFVLLQCTSQYPCEIRNVNLRAMKTLRHTFDCLAGYSDHTIGVLAPVMAVLLGAVVIEKHITLGRHMKGSDHAGSLEALGLKRVIRDIRHSKLMLGTGEKALIPDVQPFKDKLARSLVTRQDILPGEIITEEVLVLKSPGTGLCSHMKKNVIGKRAVRLIKSDELIKLEDLSE